MANKSAQKRERQNETKRMHNREIKSAVRTAVKHFEANIAKGDKKQAKESLALAIKKLDSAASKHVLHKNMVARKKSRLQKQFNNLA